MVRMVEPTKVCANSECEHAGKRQPWSSFYAKVKWEDGTMRQPAARCKDCQRVQTREWHRRKRLCDPAWQRRRQQRSYARLRSDPELWAADLARRRQWKRDYMGYRRDLHKADKATQVFVPAAPFAAWVERVMARDGTDKLGTALRLGVSDRVFRRILNGEQETVDLATVERALIADDTCTLMDVYPDLYLEAA